MSGMTEPARAVLLTRFRLISILRVVLTERGRLQRIYYDPYGTLHGPVFRVLVALVGRPRLAALIDQTARLLRLPLRQVPHGQNIPNYAPLQMAASIDATHFLDELWRDAAYRPDDPLPSGVLNRDELVSLHLKFVGVRVWQLIENVRVIRMLERGPISVRLNRRLWPAGFVSRLEQSEDVRTVDEGRGGVLPDVIVGAMLALAPLIAAATQWRWHQPVQRQRRYKVAAEIIDPDTLHGRPAEPNFLISPTIPARDFLFYIQPDRRRYFVRGATDGLHGSDVVDLARLPLTTRDLRCLASGYWRVLRASRERGIPVLALLTYLDYVTKYALLAALFERFPIAAHVYHAYPVGRAAWRHDSGLVTAVCRQHGVHSFSYQTRAHFGYAIEYCFDCFDTYCVWGEWWRETYRHQVAIGNLPLVGDVFLDGLNLHSAQRAQPATRTLVLFPCDIHLGQPSYLTLDYAIEFLEAVARAAGSRRRNGSPLQVVVKPKHADHAGVLRNHPRLTAALREEGIEFTYLTDKIHDIGKAVSMADYALSLLPTTPGIDALLTGIPSAYFNTLGWGHERFDEHPMIVKSAEEIEAFLGGRRPLEPAFVDSLDPWRDGHSRARLCAVINQIVDATRGRAAAGNLAQLSA
jgi:hypothetical protein